MRALVTRPRDDAAEISEALSTRGFEVVTAPMLIIESTGAVPDLDGAQAVMFTSANGARAFATATPERDIPVFTVGDATAKCALSLGFGRVESAGADSLALVRLVGATLDPAAGAVVHGCGEAVVGDPAGLLEALRCRSTPPWNVPGRHGLALACRARRTRPPSSDSHAARREPLRPE